jgi:hypothetical protein
MKHAWVMYIFILILVGIMARNAPGSVAVLLGGSQAASGFASALEGPSSSNSGSVAFSNGTKVNF